MLEVLLATGLDSLLGLVGVFSLYISDKTLRKVVKSLVAFAAGAMLAGALIHLIPEAMIDCTCTGELAVFGFIIFFVLERILHWHHCHEQNCPVHPMTYLTIIGDGIHNFLDGLIIAAAFLTNRALGWITTLMIIGHELPQELGNFSVLVYGGYPKEKAILWTFISQLTALFGGIIGWLFTPLFLRAPLLAFAAGGFLYIAASDLVPELHKEPSLRKSLESFFLLLIGVIFMWGLKVFGGG